MLGPTSLQVTEDSAADRWPHWRVVSRSAPGNAWIVRILLSLLVAVVLLQVDVASAGYPLTIDPLLQKGGKLTSGEVGNEAGFGTSAALSADGSTLLIGGPQDDGSQGAAWMFVRSGSSWTRQGPKQTAGEASGGGALEECAEEAADEVGECAFGKSVALSADGNTALVGDPSSNSTPGAAWVFTRSAGTWTRGPALIADGGGDDGRFGKSVALSADGATALIGDPTASAQRGEAWVFRRSGNTWMRQGMLTDSEGSQLAHFGRSVALSSDGDMALIGGPGDSSFEGAAWAFTRSGTTWSQMGGRITGPHDGGRAHFGKAVALSGDGSAALVGAPDYGEQRGAVWTLARSGSSFVQQGAALTFTSLSETMEGAFGASVALSGDGNAALIGAPHAEAGFGSVTQWTRSGGVWSPQANLGGTEAVGRGSTGASVALSSDGLVAAIGAPHDARRAGAAWVFTSVPPAELPLPAVTNVVPGRGTTDGGTEVEIRGANLDTVKEVHFGAVPAARFVPVNAVRIKAVTPPEPAGKVDVTVTTSAGTSAVSRPADLFVFEGPSSGGSDPPAAAVGSSTGATGGVLGSTASASSASSACRVSLRSKRAVVALHRSVAMRLLRTGAGPCRGTLTLRYRQKTTGQRFKLRNIGSTRFAISPGKSLVAKVALNGLGRRLFRAGHGKLNVSVAVIRTSPRPVLARTASVRLSVKKTPKRTS
jgi:hypothetical protein